MRGELTLSRRTFLGASAGAAATVALGRWAPSARASERLVPPGKLGIQLFTVRDQIPRLHNSVTDTNPANPFYGQPLPGGFRGVFEALASFGYKTVEFAGYTQGANGPITTQEIRALLDEFGLTAVGTHLSLNALRTNLAFEIERCQILGMGYIGTANRPTDDTNARRASAEIRVRLLADRSGSSQSRQWSAPLFADCSASFLMARKRVSHRAAVRAKAARA